MVLNIFPCACWHLVYLQRTVVKVLCPIFNQVICLFIVQLQESLFQIQVFYQIDDLQILSVIQWVVFTFLTVFCEIQRHLILMKPSLSSLLLVFDVIIKLFLIQGHEDLCLCFLLREFYNFRSHIYVFDPLWVNFYICIRQYMV